MPLEVRYSKQPANYLKNLDVATKRRVHEKVAEVAADYLDPKNSYPLEGSEKRSARVGKYRILLQIFKDKNVLVVAEIASRGQVYRDA
jgi:mRNA-degrading endonuclease RelE of RelBE toxin-antitoxin system